MKPKSTTTPSRPGVHPLVSLSKLAGICLLLAGIPGRAQTDCTVLTNGLVAWWPGEGHAYDVIGVKLGVNGAGYGPGRVGQGFVFDGSSQRMLIPERSNSDLSRMARWTIEAWVKPESFANATRPTIYSEGARQATLGIKNSTGELESWLNNGNQLVGTTRLNSNEWNHVALVYAGTTRTLYLNGKPDGSGSAVPVTDDSTGATIGQVLQEGVVSQFQGSIDEVSLYDRALDSNEVAAVYAAGAVGKCYTNAGPEPVFFLQPQGQTAYIGTDVTLTGLAMGTPRPTYQWLFNGNPLPGETNFTLALTKIQFIQSGDYALRASNLAGVAVSEIAPIRVEWCVEVPPGLVAWWPGDGSGLDVTGNHHGNLWGNVTYPEGIAGKAFGFNGTDAYAAVPDSPELSPHIGTNGEMTLEAWLYLDQLPTPDPITGSVYRAVITKWESGAPEYGLWITTSGTFGFWVYSTDGASQSAVGGQLLTRRWHHLVGTLKKGDAIRIYQDGVEMAQNTNAVFETADGRTPLYLGRETVGNFLPGRLDEAALYGRALEPSEIARLYDGGAFGKCAGALSPAPFFAVQPANASGYYFLKAGLSVLALGTPRPDYQWYRSNSPTAWIAVSNATNATLAFANLGAQMTGFYRVTASNVDGTVTSQPAWLDVVCHPIACATNGEDFENGWNGWTTDNSIWQLGVPTSGPGGAHHSNSVAATVLGGAYPYGTGARLISPPIELPGAAANEEVWLRFWQWFSYADADGGFVEIQVWSTNGWSSWTRLGQLADQVSPVWSEAGVDLTPWAGKLVRIGFFHQDNHEHYGTWGDVHYEGPGWYIDQVRVVTVPVRQLPFAENFEPGWRDWHADNGLWEVGRTGYQSTNCAGTVLAGNYPYSTASRLISPTLDLPTIALDEEIVLRFWHWFSYQDADNGYIQIQVNGPNGWSSWSTIVTAADQYPQMWSLAQVDLTAWAGKRVRLVFLHQDNHEHYGTWGDLHYESLGWYVDDVQVRKQPIPRMAAVEDFEVGWNNWYADNGTWEIGHPTIGPQRGHSGASCAATILAGNYSYSSWARLVSPPINLPTISPTETLSLRFWQWFSYADADGGFLEIQTWNTNEWSGWTRLGQWADQTDSSWVSAPPLDLKPWAGKRIRVGFLHQDNHEHYGTWGDVHYEGDGWYIDDLFVKRGELGIVPIPDKTTAENHCLTFPVNVIGADGNSVLAFSLGSGAPAGAQIDAETGVFTWCPTESQGPGLYTIPIYVVDYGNNEANDLGFVRVTVTEENEPPAMTAAELSVRVGETLQFIPCFRDFDCPANPLSFSLLAGASSGVTIQPGTGLLQWTPTIGQLGTHAIGVRLCDNGTPNYCTNVTFNVTVTTNADFFLEVRNLDYGFFEFTIRGGRTDLDYVLQEAEVLRECPEVTDWQDVQTVSPTEMPFKFLHYRPNVNEEPVRYFRLKDQPR